MKTLYIECNMGAAGDMLTAALIDLFSDKEKVTAELNALHIPSVEYRLRRTSKSGICGLHMDVLVGEELEGEHVHPHDNDHVPAEHLHGAHVHTHAGMHKIEQIVHALGLPSPVEDDVLAVYGLLAGAESQVHGVPVTEIHFHEVGTMDAVADIVAVCWLLNKIHADEIVASPINVGSGFVHCAHGILPVPAPATAELLKEIPYYSDKIQGELTTPTGAALLRHFVNRFADRPKMSVDSIGYGMGTKDFERANCVRAFLGESASVSSSVDDAALELPNMDKKADSGVGTASAPAPNAATAFGAGMVGATGTNAEVSDDEALEDTVEMLSCNVDDMTAEEIGFATERLLEGGALDVYTIAVGMKKNRPGTMINVLCTENKKNELVRLIFKYTTTIGIRERRVHRYILQRRTDVVGTPYGDIHIKKASGYGAERTKYEYDDLSSIALRLGKSIAEVRNLLAMQ